MRTAIEGPCKALRVFNQGRDSVRFLFCDHFGSSETGDSDGDWGQPRRQEATAAPEVSCPGGVSRKGHDGGGECANVDALKLAGLGRGLG